MALDEEQYEVNVKLMRRMGIIKRMSREVTRFHVRRISNTLFRTLSNSVTLVQNNASSTLTVNSLNLNTHLFWLIITFHSNDKLGPIKNSRKTT